MRPATTAPLRALRRAPCPRHRTFTTSRPSFDSANTAQDAQKKAQDTLNSALASAKSSLEKAQNSKAWASAKDGLVKLRESKVLEKAQDALGPAGQKAGNALGSYKEPVLYNLAVAKEFFKQVYVAELKPPTSIAQVQSTYQNLWQQAKNPTYWRTALSNGDASKLAIYGLQAYGLFKIGEIVGRFHLVGYGLH